MTPTMLALDFYDGVIEGVGRNVLDGNEAYFTMLAWDELQDMRLFALVPLEDGTFDDLFALFARFAAPRNGIRGCRRQLKARHSMQSSRPRAPAYRRKHCCCRPCTSPTSP